MNESRHLPALGGVRVGEAQVGQAVAALPGHRHVLNVVIHGALIGAPSLHGQLAAQRRPFVAGQGGGRELGRRHRRAVEGLSGGAGDVLGLRVQNCQPQQEVPARGRGGLEFQFGAQHLGVRVEDHLVEQLEAESLEVAVVVVEGAAVQPRPPIGEAGFEARFVAGEGFVVVGNGLGGVAGEYQVSIQKADIEAGGFHAPGDAAVDQQVILGPPIEFQLAAEAAFVVFGQVACRAGVEIEGDIAGQFDDIGEEAGGIDIQVVQFFFLRSAAQADDQRPILLQVELRLAEDGDGLGVLSEVGFEVHEPQVEQIQAVVAIHLVVEVVQPRQPAESLRRARRPQLLGECLGLRPEGGHDQRIGAGLRIFGLKAIHILEAGDGGQLDAAP